MKEKILFLATVDSHIFYFHLPSMRLLREMGYEVDVACADTGFKEKIEKEGFKVYLIPFSRSSLSIRNLLAFFMLLRLMEEKKYLMLHAHTPVASFIGRIAGKLAKIPHIVYTAHGFHFHEYGNKLKNFIYFRLEKFTGSFTDFSEKYYKRYVDSFEDILHNTGSIHRAISYFFMYRILPVREMQKYRLLIKENVRFSFPYIKEELVNFVSSIPESFMFSNGIRKRIIFDVAKETLPEIVYTKVTTPFYFDSSDIFKGMEDEALKTLLPSQFMLLKDRVIDKEQFEFMKRIMNVYFSSCLN